MTIYEAFIRPHLEYGDSLCDQAYNMSFHQKLESIQYKCLLGQNWSHTRHIERKALTRTRFRVIPITNWYIKLVIFYKICQSKSPQYLFKLIPEKMSSYVIRNADNIPLFNIKHSVYKSSFFPPTIVESSNLDSNFQNSENFSIFKNIIFKFVRPKPNSFFISCNFKEVRLITRLA